MRVEGEWVYYVTMDCFVLRSKLIPEQLFILSLETADSHGHVTRIRKEM